MKYYIIAGEASGDLHGSNLIRELIRRDRQADLRAWGGDMMQQAGATVVKHYRELAFMGFTEVVSNLPTIFRNIRFCKEDITSFQPDVIIFIDYPGFNLRIAGWAKASGFRTVFYISPQVWAWKESRVKLIRESIDKMLVILPFEKDFYRKWNYQVEYVGHPLVEVIQHFRNSPEAAELPDLHLPAGDGDQRPLVAMLPGSRKQEILKKLPVMLEASRSFPDYRFVVAEAPGQDPAFYDELLSPYPGVGRVRNRTYSLLLHAKAACVTSGTATLETALFGVPEVICYKGSAISYQIARRLIRVKYISLVNLIMDRPVVKELIQEELTVPNLVRELKLLLTDQEVKARILADYAGLRNLLAREGNASAKAAESIIGFLAAEKA